MAHRVHGRQMLTGWKQEPTSISDRDDTINNILIETRVTNFAKSNFPSTECPVIQKCFREINMPSELVQEELVPTRFNSRLEELIIRALERSRLPRKMGDAEAQSDSEEEDLQEWDSESGESGDECVLVEDDDENTEDIM